VLGADVAVTKVQSEPDPTNRRAIRCYEKAGFRAIRTIVTPDGPALYMLRHRAPPPLLRFKVYGHVFAVRRDASSWRVYAAGADGKLGDAGIVIPDFIAEHELARYLADIFHERARPGMDDVRRIS
jgi:hypothetical protein